MFLKLNCFAVAVPFFFTLCQTPAFAEQKSIQFRFFDAETGYAVQPDEINIHPHTVGATGQRIAGAQLQKRGHATLNFERGPHTVAVAASNYRPMAGRVEVDGDFPYAIQFLLDPIAVPKEISPEHVTTLHRKDETVFVGYVADDDGEPLKNVVVRAEPSGRETLTDARGYFQIYVPLQTLAEAKISPAKLIFQKNGFKTEERHYLELWSEGDYIYRVSLKRGAGLVAVDERHPLRRDRYPLHTKDETKAQLPSESQSPITTESEPSEFARAAKGGGGGTLNLASTTASVRIPTNIRVLLQDNVTIDYVSMQTYSQRSLNDEWFVSWANYGPGNSGTNSLNAGAVAVRTYGAGYVNTPLASTYDICASTTCQVYDSDTSTAANNAVNFTANYVMFRPGDARLAFKLTEYSSENNQLGMSCGDGYTAPTGSCLYDPVCTGEPEFGHGRGMCQWGTVKWATGLKFPGNDFSNTTQTNGQPVKDWIWICEHYYPNLVLAQGSPLAVGDDVVVIGSSVAVRQCPGNTITNGTLCPTVTGSKTVGTTGTIIGGPSLVTADTNGYTWWQVQWSDTNGWSIENYLERVSATPGAPGSLTVTAVSAYQIDLSWTDNSGNEIGYMIERAPSSGGPWATNETVRAGITNYSDTNVTFNTTYYYRVRGFNQSANSAYSNTTNATTPTPPFPIITLQPASQVKGLGQTATFIVAATGNNPLSYQWKKNGTNLGNGGNVSGTTTSILTLSNLQQSDAGSYTVVITNASGSATSSIAVLAVSGTITFQDDFDTNSAASWMTNKSSSDTRVTFNYDYSADGISSAPHSVGGTTRAVKFEANMSNGVTAAINISPVGKVFTGDHKLRFDAWININGPLPGGGTGSTEYLTSGIGTRGTNVQWTGSGTTADGVWFSVNGEGGASDTSTTTADFNAYAATTVQTTNSGVYAAGIGTTARGNGNSYYAGAFPAGQAPPVFQQNNYPQQTGTLNVGTVGFKWRNVLISKQSNVVEWFIDDLKIASVTNATLAGSNIFIGYWDPFTSVSDNAALSFGLVDNVRVEIAGGAPTISAQPQSRTNVTGTSASFSVTADGTPAPSYQWRFNGANISSATQTSYNIGSVQTNDAGSYTVVVSNSIGSVTSSVATLTVIVPPGISTQPNGLFVAAGSNATFSVVATGSAPLSYQWRFNGANVSGATQSSYTRTNAQTANAGSYTVVVTNTGGAITSSVAVLAVNNPPLLAAIASRTVHIATTLVISNSATDPETNALTFSLLSGAPVDATINSTNGLFSWTTTNATVGGVSNITVRVTDDGAPALSDEKAFAVTVIAPIVIQSISVSNNATVTFTWNSAPGATYRAQYKTNIGQTGWIDLAPDIVAADSTTSRAENVTAGAERYYRVTLVGY